MISNSLRIKPRKTDIQKIQNILSSAGNFYPFEMDIAIELLESYVDEGASSPYHFIFADEAKSMAGFICYGPIPLTEKRYDIYWIAVLRKKQGCGIGRSLIAEAEKRIRSVGGSYIYVDTSSRDDYHSSRKFYETCGYECVARVPHFFRDDDDKIIYMKKL